MTLGAHRRLSHPRVPTQPAMGAAAPGSPGAGRLGGRGVSQGPAEMLTGADVSLGVGGL